MCYNTQILTFSPTKHLFCAPSTGSPILLIRHGRQTAILLGREDLFFFSEIRTTRSNPRTASEAIPGGTVRAAAFILFPLGQFGAANTKATFPSEPGNPMIA